MIPPRFPWPFSRWRWLTDPIPAERLAAVRIATAVALLVDLLVGCLPWFNTLFTADGLAGSEAYPLRFRAGTLYWSLLRWLPDAWGPHALMAVWVAAAVGMLMGYRVFLTATVCWACAVSFQNINPWVGNGGDQLRNALLLTVACIGLVPPFPCGRGRPALAPAWPVRVMLVQMCCMYFFSAVYKLRWAEWRDGSVMYYVNHNRTWSMCPDLTAALPAWLHFFSTWLTLAWELSFPLLVCVRRTRPVMLGLGVFFHVATLVTLEVGSFATYSLVYYVPFVPWERWRTPRQSPPKRKPWRASG
jgi:hypothetical protein